MLNINQVIIAGIIGNDLELRTSNTGIRYCRFNIGTTEDYLDDSGNTNTVISWHRCIAEEDVAIELLATCQKGTNIHITGKSKSHFFNEGVGMQKEVTEAVIEAIQVVADGKEQPLDLDMILSENLIDDTDSSNAQDIPY